MRLLRLLVLLLIPLLLLPAVAGARPGGGESYSGGGDSGGGSSGGGGGGGGDGDGGFLWLIIELWFRFVFRYPLVGIPLTILIAFLLFKAKKKGLLDKVQNWDAGQSHRRSPLGSPPPPPPASRNLEAVRTLDPDFSVVLFEDFAFTLYARAHRSRTDPSALAALIPYLSDGARTYLAQLPPPGTPVTAVVVGALRVLDVRLPPPGATPARVQVSLEFETNLTTGAVGSEQTFYTVERWHFVRDASVRTRPPEKVKSLHCPNCGAPFAPAAEPGRCSYCGEAVTGGRFDWSVETIQPVRREARPPALTTTVQEVGTGWATAFHPDLTSRRADLLKEDPATTDEALAARVRLTYDQLNASWTAMDLAPVRPYVSDELFDYLQYWIGSYRRQGLRNVLEGMRLTELKMVKVVRDRWYDAVTFRLWGTGRDSTVREATGDVVAGNPHSDRYYSEYWTFIRGAEVRGAPRTDRNCPNCAAPLDTNMAGECMYCGAKVASGEFDWVLSKIEQDEAYMG